MVLPHITCRSMNKKPFRFTKQPRQTEYHLSLIFRHVVASCRLLSSILTAFLNLSAACLNPLRYYRKCFWKIFEGDREKTSKLPYMKQKCGLSFCYCFAESQSGKTCLQHRVTNTSGRKKMC